MKFCNPILSLTNPDTGTLDSCDNGRFGRLCGKCKDSIAVNSPSLHCGKCHELSGLIYFGVQIVPITIFILFILVFHISLTSPGMNAFIFFSQMITLDFPGNMYPSWIRDPNVISNDQFPILQIVGPMTIPYSIWNMNLLTLSSFSDISVCISNKMDTLEIIGFQCDSFISICSSTTPLCLDSLL